MIFRYGLILLLASSLSARTTSTKHANNIESTQTQPSPERIAEIQAALKARGLEPGSTWEETREVCRKIADEHMWQTDHVPDVRVLILLGLGGPHSDPAVAQMQGDRLDKDQRTEAARQSQNIIHSASQSGDLTLPNSNGDAAGQANSRTDVNGSFRSGTEKALLTAPGNGEKRKASVANFRRASKPKLIARNTAAAEKSGMNSKRSKRRKQSRKA